jgi:hypothetical protein
VREETDNMCDFQVLHSSDGVYAYETYSSMMDYLVWIRDLLMEGEASEDAMNEDLAVEYQAIKAQIAHIEKTGSDTDIVAHCPSWKVRACYNRHECQVDIAAYGKCFAVQAIDLLTDELKEHQKCVRADYEDDADDDCESTLAGLEQCISSLDSLKKRGPQSDGFEWETTSLIEEIIEIHLPGF